MLRDRGSVSVPLRAVIHLVQAAGGPHLPARAPSGAEIPQTAGFLLLLFTVQKIRANFITVQRGAG